MEAEVLDSITSGLGVLLQAYSSLFVQFAKLTNDPSFLFSLPLYKLYKVINWYLSVSITSFCLSLSVGTKQSL